ncbi:MAG: FGGY family carbohydrate kinase [Arachnia sp.]
MPAALGIDIGATHTKVVAIAPDGSRSVTSRATPRDAMQLLATVILGIREQTERLGQAPAAVGIASMAGGGVPLDADDVPLTRIQSWQDRRGTAAAAQRLAAEFGPEAIFAATGVRVGPQPTLAMLLSLRSDTPELWRRMSRWAGVADLVHLTLTGHLRTDHTLAGRSMAYRLPAAGEALAPEFDAKLLAAVGLGPGALPAVGLPGQPPDRVSAAVAAATGLAKGTAVVVAGHDHQVAAWAAGVRVPGQVADCVATTEAVVSLVPAAPDRAAIARHGMSLTRAVNGATEAILASSASAGSFLVWVAEREGCSVADLVNLDTVPEHLAGPGLWLPYPQGRQSPEPDPRAGARLVGDPGDAPPGLLAVEALSYQAQWMIDVQRDLAGGPAGGVTVIGQPVAVHPQWRQAKAALAQGSYLLDADEPVATGAALLALARSGAGDPGAVLSSVPLHCAADLAARYRARLPEFIAAATRPARLWG